METKDFKKIFKELNQKPIAYYPIYAKLMGDAAGGVFFSQLMFHYANAEGDLFEVKDGKLRNQTGLSRREFIRSKEAVKRFKFMSVKIAGSPPVTKYSVDFEELQIVLSNLHNAVKIDLHNAVKIDLHNAVKIVSINGVQNDSNGVVENDLHNADEILYTKDLKERLEERDAPGGATGLDVRKKLWKPCIDAIGKVSGITINRQTSGRIVKALSAIWESSPLPTVELILEKYGLGCWWFDKRRTDSLAWKGKRNEAPNPQDIASTWGVWTFTQEVKVRSDGKISASLAFLILQWVVRNASQTDQYRDDVRRLLKAKNVSYLSPLLLDSVVGVWGRRIRETSNIETTTSQFCKFYETWEPSIEVKEKVMS